MTRAVFLWNCLQTTFLYPGVATVRNQIVNVPEEVPRAVCLLFVRQPLHDPPDSHLVSHRLIVPDPTVVSFRSALSFYWVCYEYERAAAEDSLHSSQRLIYDC